MVFSGYNGTILLVKNAFGQHQGDMASSIPFSEHKGILFFGVCVCVLVLIYSIIDFVDEFSLGAPKVRGSSGIPFYSFLI